MSDIKLDIACIVARVEQIDRECWITTNEIGDRQLNSLGEFLWDRIMTCDIPRLRRHLEAHYLAAIDDDPVRTPKR